MATKLALLGGPKEVQSAPDDLFRWPIITPEIEDAVLTVLRAGKWSITASCWPTTQATHPKGATGA